MNLANNIADRLLQIKAIKLNAANPFTWASGLKSPIYCDNRLILSYPEERKIIIRALNREASKFQNIDAIAGVATAGIPWGAYLADKLELPFCYVRSKPKEHGLRNTVEGRLNPKSRVLVIEDLISTGGSSLEAVQGLQSENYEVVGVLALFQYGFQSAIERFAEKNIHFTSLTDFKTLLARALHEGYISNDEFDRLKSWNIDPKLWSDQHSNHN
ncbi:MAG: orotate phosphoribosyltransferase [Saprospiraceae bacterium]|nr:orotate phosphoribosyltransferase [Saprospiraceae bacterium]